MTLDELLKQIEERSNKTIPGPWLVVNAPGDMWEGHIIAIRKRRYVISDHPSRDPFDNESLLRFIAHSRTDIPRLVEALRYLIEVCETSGADEDTWKPEFEQIEKILRGEK